MQNLEFFMMFPSDNNRFVSEGNLAVDDNTINVPGLGTKGNTGTVFVRGVEVFNSTSATTGPGTWLIKKDQTYLSEYVIDSLEQKEVNRTRMLQDFLSIMPCLEERRELHPLLQEAFI
jgi:hypothetical protein